MITNDEIDEIFNMISRNIKYYRLNSSLCRDRAQRKLCLCLESRDIGQEHGCKFNCAYCYAFKEIKWRECC